MSRELHFVIGTFLSPVDSWFSTSLLRDSPGTVPKCVHTCGWKVNSFNLYRALKIHDSVLLNSWDSFLVNLPSISSENYVMHSSVISGTNMFSDWLFLVFSFVFLETAANFRLFISVAIFSEEMKTQQWRRLKNL